MRGRRRLAAAAWVASAGLLLSQALGGCELVVDAGKLSEESADATTESGSDGMAPLDAMASDASDATTESGSGGSDSGDAMTADVAPGDAQNCTGPLYYVSPMGEDTNPGCSSSAPKKTIAAGIAAASAFTASAPTVEVCAGTYAESNLQLPAVTAPSSPVTMLGGFDCATFSVRAGISTITNASPATQAATLVMLGSAPKLDGFTIQGAASVTTDGGASTYTYSALEITGTGSPIISNNVLTGGSGAGGAPASAGVVATSGAAPLIENNTISGGSGMGGNSSTPASVGVYATNSAAITLKANTIDGGSGQGTAAGNPSGSAGVMTSGQAGNVTLAGNRIGGGNGVVATSTSNGTGSQAVWIFGNSNPVPAIVVTGNTLLGGTGSVVTNNTTNGFAVRGVDIGYAANVVFAGNVVDGGVISSGGSCPWAVTMAGTAAVASSSVTITGNRIHAGHCTAFAPNIVGNAAAVGLHLNGPITSTLIENNMIDSGQVDLHRYGFALDINGLTGAVIRHNTLIAGASVQNAFGLWLENAALTTGTTIENNIFGAIGPNAIAIDSDNAGLCSPDGGAPGASSFRNNLVFGNLSGFLRFACSGGVATSLDAMTAAFAAPGALVGGNVTMASSCVGTDGGAETGCITMPCATDGGSCLDTVFAGWDGAGAGYGNLLSDAGFAGSCPATAPPVIGGIGEGWALVAGTGTPPCQVARSSLDDVGEAGAGIDLYGNCRGTRPSMGAAEFPADAACF